MPSPNHRRTGRPAHPRTAASATEMTADPPVAGDHPLAAVAPAPAARPQTRVRNSLTDTSHAKPDTTPGTLARTRSPATSPQGSYMLILRVWEHTFTSTLPLARCPAVTGPYPA